jgi:hypothetical protein
LVNTCQEPPVKYVVTILSRTAAVSEGYAYMTATEALGGMLALERSGESIRTIRTRWHQSVSKDELTALAALETNGGNPTTP